MKTEAIAYAASGRLFRWQPNSSKTSGEPELMEAAACETVHGNKYVII